MGSQQRRERERQELRQAILTAARDIAAREGWQAVTIRKVAEAIEYTPPIIYEYFASKEALLFALLREGFRQVWQIIQTIQAGGGPAEQILVQVALAYWRFAFTSPELYQVMHGLGGVPFGTSETPQEARSAFAAVREMVRAALEARGVQRPDLNGDIDILWSLLHGLISLTMAGRIAGGEQRAAALVERAVRDLLAAWEVEERETAESGTESPAWHGNIAGDRGAKLSDDRDAEGVSSPTHAVGRVYSGALCRLRVCPNASV